MGLLERIFERIQRELGDIMFPAPCDPVKETVKDMIAQVIDTFDDETGCYKTSMVFIITIGDATHIGHGHYRYDIRVEPRLKGMF